MRPTKSNRKTFRSKRNRRTRRQKQPMYLQNGGVGNVDTSDKNIFVFRSDKICLQPNTDPAYKAVGVIHITESGAVNAVRAFATGVFNIVGAQGFDNPVYDNARNYALKKLADILEPNQKVSDLRMEVTNEQTVFFVHLYGTLLEKTEQGQTDLLAVQTSQPMEVVHQETATPPAPMNVA